MFGQFGVCLWSVAKQFVQHQSRDLDLGLKVRVLVLGLRVLGVAVRRLGVWVLGFGVPRLQNHVVIGGSV